MDFIFLVKGFKGFRTTQWVSTKGFLDLRWCLGGDYESLAATVVLFAKALTAANNLSALVRMVPC